MANSRATGSLYTGTTSRSYIKQRDARQKRTTERLELQAQLEPHEAIVFGEIAALKTEIALEIVNLINADTDKEDVKSIVIGLRLATTKMTSLETRLKNVLRKRIAAETEADDEATDEANL